MGVPRDLSRSQTEVKKSGVVNDGEIVRQGGTGLSTNYVPLALNYTTEDSSSKKYTVVPSFRQSLASERQNSSTLNLGAVHG
jgi:hypothetical protein